MVAFFGGAPEACRCAAYLCNAPYTVDRRARVQRAIVTMALGEALRHRSLFLKNLL